MTTSPVGASPETKLRARVKLLEGELRSITKHNLTCESIREQIFDLAAVDLDPPQWVNKPIPLDHPGVPVTVWSDWHFGETVNHDQVGGLNKFNRTIACQRIRRLVDRVQSLALDHMVKPKYPGIVVCLGGDIITGAIHEELAVTNDGTVQQALLEVEEHLAAGIEQLAKAFGQVFVPCVVGNHGRDTLKPRFKNRIFQSYEWNLYCHLARHFRSDNRVWFLIPGEADAHFSVLGHRFMLTHGDALGVRGGDGIIGCLGPIARGTLKVGRSESQVGRDFDTLLMGHWHTYIPRGDAVPVVVNGCLVGYNEYARLQLRAPYSRPSQALFFVHQTHGITAQWPVLLDEKRRADAGKGWVSWRNAA